MTFRLSISIFLTWFSTLGVTAQQDYLIYTDKHVYFPGEQLCLRVIWPETTDLTYLQAVTPTGEVAMQAILDFEGSRDYSNCMVLPDEMHAGNYTISVADENGLVLSTAIVLYGEQVESSDEVKSLTWKDPPAVVPGNLPDLGPNPVLTGPVKEEALRLTLPGDLQSYHIAITDSKFTAFGGQWMRREQVEITGSPAVQIKGQVQLNGAPPPLLLANLTGESGDFSGATVQQNGTFQLNNLNIRGPTRIKFFLPEDLKGHDIEFEQIFPEVPLQKSGEMVLPVALKDELDLYLKLNQHYRRQSDEVFLPDNSLFTGVKRTYLLNEYLPLPTVEDIVSDILAGVRVVKENNLPVDVRINDDALLSMDEPVAPLIFVNDNLLANNSAVFNLPVASIYRITVIPSIDSRDIFGYVGIGGALSISLTEDLESIRADAEGWIRGPLSDLAIRGPESVPNYPDFRSTLFWGEHMSGKTAKLDFSTTDFAGEYLIRVSGINQQGQVQYFEGKVEIKF